MNTKTHKQTEILTQPATTLVLGGNGKTGRRIVERLEAAGLPVRIGSRSGTPVFDWNDFSSWGAVLEGVGAVYIAYYPDLAIPGATEQICELVALAKEKSVERLVLLSGRGEEEAQLCERIVMHSDIPATVVRCAWFNQNFSEAFMRDLVMAGTIALPMQAVLEPWVDAEDIADVSFAALTESGHTGKLYELTGPRLLSLEDVAQELSDATGRSIRSVDIPVEEFVAGLEMAQLPADMVQLLRYLCTVVLDGRNSHLANGVQEALGRPARDFRDFAREAEARGLWSQLVLSQ